eukprot:c21532_g1_i2 orf=101-787(+)
MVAPNLKRQTLTLMDQRTAIEAQMDSIISRLTAPGAPGLSGNLLDSEGFPRAGIDIPAIRADRQQLAVLRSDHKEITEKIEKNLHILHSGGFTSDSTLPQKRTAEGEELGQQRIGSGSTEGTSTIDLPILPSIQVGPIPMEEDCIARIPFAVFDEVSEGSPAALDGIMVGDRILKFGSVDGGDNLLPRIAREGQSNQGRGIPVTIMRHGIQMELIVTPRLWSGRGLLG